MATFTPALINITVMLVITLMRTIRFDKGNTQTEGQATEDMVKPNGVSG
jgi:hypothetical protein